jgi:tryptophanyl-tRNA synthetase
MKPVIVSGIQPTGKLHLGNYLGVLKHLVELQNSGAYSCYFLIADLHSLTIEYTPKEKVEQIIDIALDFLAAGIDPKKSTLFLQSAVPAHTELAWLLTTITPFGELRRMTQFKDKSEHAPENINVGLFSYPVLMAADVLLYDATLIPVGDDQLQHLELARTLVRKFNSEFGKTFIEPKPMMTEVSRLMSLHDPEAKMSKSSPSGCIFLDDSPAIIKKKIMSAVTDSFTEVAYDPKTRPAMANLLHVYSAMSGKKIETIVDMYKSKGYADFKKELAEVVINALAPFQEKKKELRAHIEDVRTTLQEGAHHAQEVANKKLLVAKKKMGLV